jgi:hypothetical protein
MDEAMKRLLGLDPTAEDTLRKAGEEFAHLERVSRDMWQAQKWMDEAPK